MKRRQVIQALLVTPAIAVAPAAAQTQRPAADPVLTTTTPDSVGDAVARYFSGPQAAALRRLGELIVPEIGGRPGAREAGAAEFLDFLVSQSPADRQALYREGLDRLQAESRRRYSKAFEELPAEQADAIVAPLHAAWTYSAPPDRFARFLRQAKEDLLTATFNSREFAEAQTAAGRRGSGMGTYWLPIE